MTKQTDAFLEGHPFDHLVRDRAQARRIAARIEQLVAEDAALKRFRLASGVAQKDLAESMGVSAPAVAQLETRDLECVQLGTLRRYFDACGYDVEIVLTAKPID